MMDEEERSQLHFAICIALLLIALLIATSSHAQQQFELRCPSTPTPTQVINPPGTTFDTTTSRYRQWLCVDLSGNVTIQNVNLLNTTGTGGSGVGPGTSGQFGIYNSANTIIGSTALDSGLTTPNTITATQPFAMSGKPIQFPSFPTTNPSPVSGLPQLSVSGAGGGAGAGFYISSGSTIGGSNVFFRVATSPTVNSTLMNTQSFTLVGTAPNTCSATNAPANSYCVTFYTAGANTGQISGAIAGDGIATDCLIGTGLFSPCPATITNPITLAGTALTNLGTGTTGGFGVSATGQAMFSSGATSPGGTAGVWTAIPTVQVNGLTGATTTLANFNSNVPAAPTNGINVTWNRGAGGTAGSISAAIVGNGNAANCLSGTSTYVPCGGPPIQVSVVAATGGNVSHGLAFTSTPVCTATPIDSTPTDSITWQFSSVTNAIYSLTYQPTTLSISFMVICVGNPS